MRIPSRTRRFGAVSLTALFVLSVLSITPGATAAALIPFCGPASLTDSTVSVTAGNYDPALCEATTGRVFPEAIVHQEYFPVDPSGHTNTGAASDFVSFNEFQANLDYLVAQYPDYIEVHNVGESVGWDTPTGHNSYPVYMLEITNEKSPIPLEERQSLLFMLSIHGVEKGGREGGMRVLEDLMKGIGFAGETVQDGSGLPSPIAKPSGGGDVQTYQDYLDFMRVFLLFPNPDGWAHDELENVATGGTCGGNGVLFCRANGNGVDLNRQAPTLGWHNSGRDPVGQPEAIGYYNWMLEQAIDWTFAIDIHGMLNHQNFGAIMLPAGSMSPTEMERSLSLAQTLKDRLNTDPHFDAWESVFTAGESVEGTACSAAEECFTEGALSAAGSSQFAEYYTVIDAIGYTDSGFNGDWFAQDTGLNAPGYDIELAYNHMTFDSAYSGPGQVMNDYHVKVVREIVKSFLDAAALDMQLSLETHGARTLYVESPYIATNLDDVDADGNPAPNLPSDSWAARNPGDDLWDYSEETPFVSRPAKYWEDLKPFVRDGEAAGVLVKTTGSSLTANKLSGFDNLVIAGSAIETIQDSPATIEAIKAWVEDGGNLVLTDSALQYLDLAGITTTAVDVVPQYMGGIKVQDYFGHPLLEDVRGGVMQMYEPTPIGFGTTGSSPNWFVTESAFTGAGGTIAGRMCGSTQLNNPGCDANGISLGTIPLGAGQIHIMGALLPDPTEEFYHPYGLDHYATTYSGNQIMLNMLGWDKVYIAPPVVINEAGQIVQTPNEPVVVDAEEDPSEGPSGKKSPGLGPLVVLGLVGAAVAIRRKD